MADQHKNDVVMRFTTKEGDVDAECALDKQQGDKFMDGFQPQTYDSFSNFFEVQKFSFGFEVKDEAASKGGAGMGATNKTGAAGGVSRPPINRVAGTLSQVTGDFASWRSATDEQAKDIKFQLEFENFRFDRLIDSASPIFFQYCVDSKSFASAVLVKRLSVDQDSRPRGFLRMEFKDVLITSLSWDDGDMTTEKCEFICREYVMKWKRQLPNGALAEAVAQVSWKASDEQGDDGSSQGLT